MGFPGAGQPLRPSAPPLLSGSQYLCGPEIPTEAPGRCEGYAAPALASLRSAAEELDGIVATVAGEYIAGRGPFPERLPEVALTGSFLAALSEMFRSYAEWADGFVGSMEDDPAQCGLDRLRELHEDATGRTVSQESVETDRRMPT